MSRIPTIEEELTGSKVNSVSEAIWREALAQPEFADTGVIWCYSASTASDHRNGRCCDFMVTYTKEKKTRVEQVALGNRQRAYFVKHADRLHVQGIIWNGQVTGFPINHPFVSSPDVDYRGPSGQARKYSGSDQHTDHNHVQVTGQTPKFWLPKIIIPDVTVPASPGKVLPQVSLSALIAAAKADPERAQGVITPGSADDVLIVEAALHDAGYLASQYAYDGAFGTSTVTAWSRWQQSLGFKGKDADGIPGETSLLALGKARGFTVIK